MNIFFSKGTEQKQALFQFCVKSTRKFGMKKKKSPQRAIIFNVLGNDLLKVTATVPCLLLPLHQTCGGLYVLVTTWEPAVSRACGHCEQTFHLGLTHHRLATYIFIQGTRVHFKLISSKGDVAALKTRYNDCGPS